MRKSLSLSTVLTAVFALILVAGCASNANQYASATAAYNAESAQYATDRATIDTSYSAGKVTAAQYDQYVTYQKAYAAADNLVFADLAAWKASGAQPVNYSTDAIARTAAAGQVSAIAKAVK